MSKKHTLAHEEKDQRTKYDGRMAQSAQGCRQDAGMELSFRVGVYNGKLTMQDQTEKGSNRIEVTDVGRMQT